MDQAAMIEELQRVARELGTEVLGMHQFQARTRHPAWRFQRLFPNWSDAVRAAGLTPAANPPATEDELMREMAAVFVRYGGLCPRARCAHLAKRSVDVSRRRFGSWSEALVAFRRWVEKTGEPFPFLDQLPHASEPRKKFPVARVGSRIARPVRLRRRGLPFGFRGYVFEPVNEQGVVALFGTVFQELGFTVETLRVEYPDCEACRRVEGRDDLWEAVAIEFEYRSSGFRRGGHDAAGCELVVCWIHDWPECPVEVLELRSAVAGLRR